MRGELGYHVLTSLLLSGSWPPWSWWRGLVPVKPGVTVACGPRGPIGYGKGPHSFAACRDEKLMNVSDAKAFGEERIWVNRVTCEIVFQPVTDATRGACAAVREKLNLHLEVMPARCRSASSCSQYLHPDTGARVHEERVLVIREEPILHLSSTGVESLVDVRWVRWEVASVWKHTACLRVRVHRQLFFEFMDVNEFGSIASLARLYFSFCIQTLTPRCTSRFRVLRQWSKIELKIENTVLLVFCLGFHSFATKDIDHDDFSTGKIRGRLFVEMSLMTTATTMRKIVFDGLEKRYHIAIDFVAKLSSTAESSDNDKTYVLPDENFITVGVERFRFAEILFQANVST